MCLLSTIQTRKIRARHPTIQSTLARDGWPFTGNTADIGTGLGGVGLAAAPVVEVPASVEVEALWQGATSQG